MWHSLHQRLEVKLSGTSLEGLPDADQTFAVGVPGTQIVSAKGLATGQQGLKREGVSVAFQYDGIEQLTSLHSGIIG